LNKRLFLLLVLIMALVMIAGCGEAPDDQVPEEEVSEEAVSDEEVPAPDPGDAAFSTLGMGVVTSINRSLDYDPENEIMPMAQVDNVIVVAAFDGEGRVANLFIDAAQTRVNFDEDLQVTSDLTAEIKTKKELGDDYGMRAASGIGAEWDEQIVDLKIWMIGRTVDEIKALDLTEGGAPDDPDLATMVTIAVTDYISALEKAYNNAVSVEPGAQIIGFGTDVSIDRSVGYTLANDTEILPMAQVDTVIVGFVSAADSTIHGVLIDTAQTRVEFDAEGQVVSDRAGQYLTKKELGNEYGMLRASGIEKEWDEQIAALEEWMVGKTWDQILAMDLDENNAPGDPDLVTAVTISVADYLSVFEKATENIN
jgi:predicted small lipoprotein YifL